MSRMVCIRISHKYVYIYIYNINIYIYIYIYGNAISQLAALGEGALTSWKTKVSLPQKKIASPCGSDNSFRTVLKP